MSETIVALATPPGLSGIAVVRLSGDNAIDVAQKHFQSKIDLTKSESHRIYYGQFVKKDGLIIDTVTVSIFREPNSYTGENVIEVSSHGAIIVYNEIINTFIESGARLAKPGEFTQRAFLNGKLDLLQAEAVADLINSVSFLSEQASERQLEGSFTNRVKKFKQELIEIAGLLELELDFSEEDIEFIDKNEIKRKIYEVYDYIQVLLDDYNSSQILRTGFYISIIGFPNTGKSTLFNTMLDKKRAIVSDIPGTTRDYLEEYIYLNGIPAKLFDTAGIRKSSDIIELQGIKLVDSIIKQSNLLLVLNDSNLGIEYSDNLIKDLKSNYGDKEIILLQNKIDISKIQERNESEVLISAKYGIGIDKLKEKLYDSAHKSISRVNDQLINQRQYNLLYEIKINLMDALNSIDNNMENEFISIDVRKAIKKIGELTGEIYNEEILNSIFSKFCIGK